jgi:hypothetical protein
VNRSASASASASASVCNLRVCGGNLDHIPPKDDPNANLGFPSSRRIEAGGGEGFPAKSHHILFVTGNKSKDGEAHAAASRALKLEWFIKRQEFWS